MTKDIDRLVASIAPDPGPGLTPGALELLDEIASATIAPARVTNGETDTAIPVLAPRWRPSLPFPRLLGAVVAAALAIIVPVVWSTGAPAYAVTKNPDGTVTVKVSELRDPEGLQSKLIERGVPASVTFVPSGSQCAPGRFRSVDAAYGTSNTRPQEAITLRSQRVTRVVAFDTLRIHPMFIRRGETLVLEFSTSDGPSNWRWSLGSWLAAAGTVVHPCTLVSTARRAGALPRPA
ncbi:hypothetical protein Sme01_44300 [Sphaerisporangium melleum]|uniref:Uncharacterized protein n=1 Tax=Sphaerisporangium melleum TaxID=321316 RepID=A0A917R0U5_9ACTN|nr:hypothetical protein [Sphaerisporangium melleum]GGK81171.1 hypothetical protein GCM10007964_24810 [Sphaerisporangium melleum]GII71954.1 hypothetical protein Sme01_44300 [Sphaerisporangium melleum]